MCDKEGEEREEAGTPKGWLTTNVQNPEKIPWLQNWSDRRRQQHRRLPLAENTLAPPLVASHWRAQKVDQQC